MGKVKLAVGSVSMFWLTFQIGLFGFNEKMIYWMFALSPVLMVWMIYTILRHGKSSNETFDDRFYDDHSYRRNGQEELVKESEELFPGY